MPRLPPATLTALRYRAARRYRVVSPDELPPSVASHFAGCREDPEFGGALLPLGRETGALRALTRAASDLFRSLTRPRRLDPASVGGPDALARLVLDGVLEIEHEGAFVSGAGAHRAYFDGVPPARQASRLAVVSDDAVRYAESLGVDDSRVLRQRLYRYHARPASPDWWRRLAGDGAVARFLRIGRGNRPGLVHALEAGWHYWRPARGPARGRPAFKLYVSPGVDDVPAALEATLAVLGRTRGMVAAKVGRDVHALLRPDKLVAYFRDRDALRAASAELGAALRGMPAHGVPFTADLTGDGLLSWAADPPADTISIDWVGDGSWRAWVAGRLGSSLALAASEPGGPAPAWLFALDRLSLDGVDLATWAPTVGAWAAGAN